MRRPARRTTSNVPGPEGALTKWSPSLASTDAILPQIAGSERVSSPWDARIRAGLGLGLGRRLADVADTQPGLVVSLNEPRGTTERSTRTTTPGQRRRGVHQKPSQVLPTGDEATVFGAVSSRSRDYRSMVVVSQHGN